MDIIKKGKCYSQVDRGQRKKGDFYETPYSLTQTFLDCLHLSRNEFILNPAEGNGAISKVLKDNGYKVTSYDIIQGKDFLQEDRQYDWIIENPPFSLAYEFIQKAKQVARYGFAFLLPLSYLHGKKRYDDIWRDIKYPLSEIYVFTRYPMLGDPLRADGKFRTGMTVYAWFVWEKDYTGEPVINWIDVNDYVLKKGE
jgi:hypothetical protein